MSLEVRVKEEPVWESEGDSHKAQGDPLANHEAVSEQTPQHFQSYAAANLKVEVDLIKVEVKSEQEVLEEAPRHSECAGLVPVVLHGHIKVETEVKDESEWGVSEAAARAGLYAGHAVKDELVLGPEGPQPPGAAFALRASFSECAGAARAELGLLSPASAERDSGSAPSTYVCDTCGKTFRQKHYLISHIKVHLQRKSEELRIQSSSLNICERFRVKKRPFSCECQKQFTSLHALKSHRLIHKGEKPYVCDVCKKQFTQLSHLKRHKPIHTGEKEFVCDVCKKVFTVLDTLKTHKRIHSNEKHYACEICERRFVRLQTLKTHELIHSDVRPHTCRVCGKEFRHLGALTRHTRLHASEKSHARIMSKQRTFEINMKTSNFDLS